MRVEKGRSEILARSREVLFLPLSHSWYLIILERYAMGVFMYEEGRALFSTAMYLSAVFGLKLEIAFVVDG